MDKQEFEVFRAAVEDAFLALYIIDVGSLTSIQKEKHQELLSVAYLAVVRLENVKFAELTEKTRKKLEELSSGAVAIRDKLSGLKKATETLKIVDAAVNILISITRLLK